MPPLQLVSAARRQQQQRKHEQQEAMTWKSTVYQRIGLVGTTSS
jgi:hypothetical protein